MAEAPRHRAVLEKAAIEAGWGKTPAGRSLGLALHESYGSIVAEAADVSIDGEKVVLHRFTVAIDCGRAVNPNLVAAQMEGGVAFGLTAACLGEITIQSGTVRQAGFRDYPMLKMKHMPEVDVHIVESGAAVGGAGEPGVPPAAPALSNAIFAACGRRVRRLPITREGFRL